MVLFRGVCEALQAMHNYKVGRAPGGKGAQSRAKRVRADAARADRGEDRGRDDDDELGDAEPLMEGEITMAQEGMSEGQVRAYAHRDIKPGKKHRLRCDIR
jgi:serine/threonine kinase 16